MSRHGFAWGIGASGASLEGLAPDSTAGRELDVTDAPRPDASGIGFRSTYRDDLDRFAAAGVTEVRLPVEWARVEPTNGRVDVAEIEHLRAVFGAARESGLDVWACLVDGTLPGWFAHDERGFSDERSRKYFWARHVERAGEFLGDLVAGWVPFHEPNRWAHLGWIDGVRPPRRVADGRGFAVALEGALLATVDAARRLRSAARPVATSTWTVPLFAARPDPDTPADPATEAATAALDRVLWGTFRRMLAEEVVAVGDRSPVAVPGARDAFDEIGFTYRQAAAVRADGAMLPYPQTMAVEPDGRVTWAHGFALALHHVADAFPDHALRVTGVGATAVEDDRQEEYVREVSDVVVDARDGGMDLRGVWWESPVDAPRHPGRGLWTAGREPRPAASVWASR